MTSPKKSTAVTEMMMAHTEGTIESKKIGSASIAKALDRSKVTKRK
jgi:hypothetical protein